MQIWAGWGMFFCALLTCGVGTARTFAAPTSEPQLQFKAAMQRVQSKQPDLPDTPALKSYVIYDYLQSARLRRDLLLNPNEELDTRIDTFLGERAGQPVTRTLRREWLLSLGMRARWDWFLPRSPDLKDPSLICLRLAGRLATGDMEGLQDAVLIRWRLPQSQPAECASVFVWLRQQNLITSAMAEERTRAALTSDNGRLARDFINDVPAPQNAPLLQWIRLLQTPRPEIDSLVRDPSLAVEPSALVTGFTRLAVADYPAAKSLLPGLLKRTDTSAEITVQLQRAAALGAAYSRNQDAVAAFDQVPAAPSDIAVQEWRVRAALWAGSFAKAGEWIAQMPTELAALPRWRYWRARALAQSEGSEAASPLFAELAKVRDYYGYLAADQSRSKYQLNARALTVDASKRKLLSTEEGLIRAHALFDCDLYDEAGVEWAVALANDDAATKMQAALLASHWGWYSQSIAVLAQLGEWDDVRLRYPHPFDAAVADASQRARVPRDWIYAVIRQESLYKKQAVSSAGARGLMQVLPSTASALAKRWKVKLPAQDALFDPQLATILGAAHLRELLDDYADALPLSLAAYNAGAVPVARWLPAQSMDADIWIENIPYPETRSYVQRVLEHIVAFAWVRKAPLPRLAVLMPPVSAAAAR